MADFEKAFLYLMRHEDASLTGRITFDTGGKTKYGISQNAYPNEDIDNLTLERAKFLCKRDYWDKCCLDLLENDKIAAKILDMDFNMGEGTVGRMVQVLCLCFGAQVTVDGDIGPATIKALNDRIKALTTELGSMVVNFGLSCLQMYHYSELLHKDPKTYSQFWNGYVSRAKENP